MAELHELKGGCHCGNLTVLYKTTQRPEDAKTRACDCSFCRKHNTQAVCDPLGSLEVSVADAGLLNRYRFGLKTADFLVCNNCGVYVGALMHGADENTGFATLMASVLDARARYSSGKPADFSAEDETARRQRRREQWTPARLRFG